MKTGIDAEYVDLVKAGAISDMLLIATGYEPRILPLLFPRDKDKATPDQMAVVTEITGRPTPTRTPNLASGGDMPTNVGSAAQVGGPYHTGPGLVVAACRPLARLGRWGGCWPRSGGPVMAGITVRIDYDSFDANAAPLSEADVIDIIAFHLVGQRWACAGVGCVGADPSAITIMNVRAVMPTAGDHRRLGR